MNDRFSLNYVILLGKVTGDEEGRERERQSCRTISGSGSGTKFGCGSGNFLLAGTCDFRVVGLIVIKF